MDPVSLIFLGDWEESTAWVFSEQANRFICVWKSKRYRGITDRGNTPGGAQSFTLSTLSANDYEREFKIIQAYRVARKMGDPLTEADQFALRTELGKIMRTPKIARQGALYESSASSQTFETTGEAIVNPIDFVEIADANLANTIIAANYSHMPCFEAFGRSSIKIRTRQTV